MLGIGTFYMGTGDPIYDGAPRRKPRSDQFVGPEREFRQSVLTECLGQRYIGGITTARDQNSRKPRFVVPGANTCHSPARKTSNLTGAPMPVELPRAKRSSAPAQDGSLAARYGHLAEMTGLFSGTLLLS